MSHNFKHSMRTRAEIIQSRTTIWKLLIATIVISQVCTIIPQAKGQSPISSSSLHPPSSSSSSPSPSSSSLLSNRSSATILNSSTPLRRFTFGSCNKHDKPQPMWDIMAQREPQLFIWLGDVVYADKASGVGRSTSLTTMKSAYRSQYTQPSYDAFRTKIGGSSSIIGIYDDHDYGLNDGDMTYVDKESARQLFLDFIDESPSSPRRYRDGIYADYIFGPPGQRTKIILLDGRYNRDPVNDDMLGSHQWDWLANSIESDDDIQLYILGVGVQLVSTDKRIGEGWRLAPKSRGRIFDLFARRVNNPKAALVFLSGDIHLAEADVTYICTQAQLNPDSSRADASVRVTPFYEFTSSGLTHSVGSQFTHTLMTYVLPYILQPRLSYGETESLNYHIRGFWPGLNFGSFEIDWEGKMVQVEMVDDTGFTRLRYQLPFHLLSSTTYKNHLSIPSILSDTCESERIREESPPMFVIPGVKFMIGGMILSQIGLASFIAVCWHWMAKRAEWKAKRRAAREAFKLTLQEKIDKAQAKKKN